MWTPAQPSTAAGSESHELGYPLAARVGSSANPSRATITALLRHMQPKAAACPSGGWGGTCQPDTHTNEEVQQKWGTVTTVRPAISTMHCHTAINSVAYLYSGRRARLLAVALLQEGPQRPQPQRLSTLRLARSSGAARHPACRAARTHAQTQTSHHTPGWTHSHYHSHRAHEEAPARRNTWIWPVMNDPSAYLCGPQGHRHATNCTTLLPQPCAPAVSMCTQLGAALANSCRKSAAVMAPAAPGSPVLPMSATFESSILRYPAHSGSRHRGSLWGGEKEGVAGWWGG